MRVIYILFLGLVISCSSGEKEEKDVDIQMALDKKINDYRRDHLDECRVALLVQADSLAKILIEEEVLGARYMDSLPLFPDKPEVTYQKEKTKSFNPRKIKE